MRNVRLTILAVAVSLSLCGSAVAADPVFDHRENVNILSTWNPAMQITSKYGTIPAASFRIGDTGHYDYYDRNFDYDNYLNFNFGDVHNIKTISLLMYNTHYVKTFDVFALDNNGEYTVPVPCSYEITSRTVGGHVTGTITLLETGGLDTQFLRIVPTELVDAGGRLYIMGIRAFGDVGTLSPKNNDIDLIASTALAGGATGSPVVTIEKFGDGTSWDSCNSLHYVDDATTPMGYRQIVYNFTTGDSGIIINFTNGIAYDFYKLGLSGGDGYNNADAEFVLHYRNGDEGAWIPVVFEDDVTRQILPKSYGYFDLPEGIIATAIKLTVVNPGTGGQRNDILDVQLFGTPVPEPATMTLLALGGLAMLRRRK